jgi:hypothetical protein
MKVSNSIPPLDKFVSLWEGKVLETMLGFGGDKIQRGGGRLCGVLEGLEKGVGRECFVV